MAQSTITNFYNSRKRPAFDELKGKSKVMALESGITETGYNDSNSVDNAKQTLSRIGKESTVFSTAEVSKLKPQKVITRASRTTRTPAKNGRRTTKPKELKQPNLKSFLLSKEEDTSTSAEGQVQVDLPIAKNQSDGPGPNVDSEDSIEVKEESSTSETLVKNLLPERAPGEVVAVSSDLSSNIENFRANESSLTVDVTENQNMKVSSSISHGIKSEQSRSSNANVTSNDNTDSVCRPVTNEKPASTQSINDKLESIRSSERKETSIEKARRELSLGDIKSKLTRSARLAELKASLTRFDEGREKLKQISKVKQDDKPVGADGPQLNQFNAIELEVPISPSKSPMKSPMKSPLKNLIGSRSPAFQRYSSLAQSGIPSLTLPNSYRHLAELFRCVDTVSSILFNRKEIITFRKLQKGVQEMSRKNFSPTHLAQIVTVLPDSYILKQEKVHNFGTPSKHDKYQLVIEPIIEPNQNGVMSSALSMTPSVLLERRRRFYSNILDIVKKHHHEFLLSLDPPLNVARQSLTRWHPEFAVDQVPEVVAATLPQPPNMEKCYTAKDVLAKARGLFSCNSRMEKALQSVAAQYNNNGLPSTDTIVSVEPPTNTNSQPATPAVNTQMSSALKGIPKALLEKIRARQAAKAMEAMTRTPAQCKEAAQYARLPELARILRNVFVVEKKGALPLETVIEKVGDSYRSALSPGELDHHIRLLAKSVPGWLTFEHLLNMDYLRLSKKADMNRVIQKLHDLANSKRGS